MSVAVSSSPVFSPSAKLFSINKASSDMTLSLTLTHLKSSSSTSAPSSSSPCSSPSRCSSPASPFRLRLAKPPSGFSPSSNNNSISAAAAAAASAPTSSGLGWVGSTGALLKRKRPTKLDIPLTSFGGFSAATPRGGGKDEERRDVLEREGDEFEFGVYCKRGRREAMEDRYSALVNIDGDSKKAFFGVFDGHGGSKAAEFVAQNLHKNVMNELEKRGDENIEDAVKSGYLNTDDQFLKEDVRGGSCCVTALIQKGNLVVSNAGDCRAVVSEGGVAVALTSDHRPSREDERNRIQALGGYVDLYHGVWRVQGSLAVTRGIGDRHLKQWILAEPETKNFNIKPEHEFLILASDGLWDKVSNQEAIDIAHPLCMGDKPQPVAACKKLVELAVLRGSADDTSVMLIRLKYFIDNPVVSLK